MKRDYTITAETDRQVWRQTLINEVKTGDELVITLNDELSFTQLRQLITSLNAVAWQREATVRYADDLTAGKPPLQIKYSKAPSITAPKLC
jgi:hypothetical protein